MQQVKQGQLVDYRSIKGGRVTHSNRLVLSDPWATGGGHMLVRIEGVSGGVSVAHLELVQFSRSKEHWRGTEAYSAVKTARRMALDGCLEVQVRVEKKTKKSVEYSVWATGQTEGGS